MLKFTRYNLTWIATPTHLEVNNHEYCGDFDYTPKHSIRIPHDMDFAKIERVWRNPLFFFFDSVTQHFNFEAFGAKEETCDTDCPITNLTTETKNIHIRVSDEMALIYLEKFRDYIAFAIKVYYPTIPAPVHKSARDESMKDIILPTEPIIVKYATYNVDYDKLESQPPFIVWENDAAESKSTKDVPMNDEAQEPLKRSVSYWLGSDDEGGDEEDADEDEA